MLKKNRVGVGGVKEKEEDSLSILSVEVNFHLQGDPYKMITSN